VFAIGLLYDYQVVYSKPLRFNVAYLMPEAYISSKEGEGTTVTMTLPVGARKAG
jgi:hypothetical protein